MGSTATPAFAALNPMQTPTDALSEFFTKNDWNPEVGDEGRRFITHFAGKAGHWSFIVAVMKETDDILAVSVLPAIVPATRRPVFLATINGLNHELRSGSFALDPDSGEVRFRSLLIVPEEGTSVDAVNRLVILNLMTVDHHFAEIMRAIYTQETVSETMHGPGATYPRFDWN